VKLFPVAFRDRGEVLADALKTLLWEGKQQDMLRAAAFIKRLATFALSFGSAEAIAGLFWVLLLLSYFELVPAKLSTILLTGSRMQKCMDWDIDAQKYLWTTYSSISCFHSMLPI